jgi:hypothetical protein
MRDLTFSEVRRLTSHIHIIECYMSVEAQRRQRGRAKGLLGESHSPSRRHGRAARRDARAVLVLAWAR